MAATKLVLLCVAVLVATSEVRVAAHANALLPGCAGGKYCPCRWHSALAPCLRERARLLAGLCGHERVRGAEQEVPPLARDSAPSYRRRMPM